MLGSSEVQKPWAFGLFCVQRVPFLTGTTRLGSGAPFPPLISSETEWEGEKFGSKKPWLPLSSTCETSEMSVKPHLLLQRP